MDKEQLLVSLRNLQGMLIDHESILGWFDDDEWLEDHPDVEQAIQEVEWDVSNLTPTIDAAIDALESS